MRLFMYAIYDSCSGVYDRPFCMQADPAAVRAFSDLATDRDHPIGKHCEHYSLYRIGTFDDNKAVIEPEDAICIARGHELAAQARAMAAVPELDKDGYPLHAVGGTD